MFSDTKDTHFNTVDFFDKFHSDRFSDTQAEEIRNIITVTMEKRGYVPEPVTAEEPVIVHNEVVETAKLPPLLDENIINGFSRLSVTRLRISLRKMRITINAVSL